MLFLLLSTPAATCQSPHKRLRGPAELARSATKASPIGEACDVWITAPSAAVSGSPARRGPARFCAFDLLWLHGRDLRGLPGLERKARLFDLLPADDARLLNVDHVEGDATRFPAGSFGNYREGSWAS
jgi:hypothetical protein